ncbi:MAG: acetyl-CoA carboxylase biotin carboxylase subunit [Proteobacteria bacterium]|nr:MAG: acetyl-CoA carboxylase biotin carboxylase subunit [Pseudomonadota bacterium]
MRKVLIANRGEIALRAIRACRKNGLSSVAVYSTADAASPHVFAADEAVCIGPQSPRDSYLVADNLIETALGTGCDAVYPGYGFLAENADFAEQCVRRGLVFVGPQAESIRLMGDKASARKTVERLGVPVVPGSPNAFTSLDAARPAAEEIGFPLLIKASAGGGGRGMRVARSLDEFDRLFEQANAEAEAAFGNGELYLERFFDRVRHIEIQVFGDSHGGARHLWERDCSVQRRHQKLVEEAPSPVLGNATRRQMAEAALAIVEGIGYRNAGTIEFIYDMASGEFFFIEMNTRIQVEHPVTEMLTHTDLVAEQFRVAAGKRLRLPPLKRLPRGSFIEWRICAEDPANNFMPAAGRVKALERPDGPGVRFDTHVYPGYEIPPYYDSMIGKLIAGGDNRKQAISNSAHALRALVIDGVKTTIPFHLDILAHEDFLDGSIHTRWIEDQLGT